MRWTLLMLIGVLGIADAVGGQTDSAPEAVPLFSNVERSPAFMIECVNARSVPLDPITILETNELRIDGEIQPRDKTFGGGFALHEPTFAPGDHFRIMIGLRQRLQGTKSATLGAIVRDPWYVHLTDGWHTLAFRCGGVWSRTVPFYWESDTVRN